MRFCLYVAECVHIGQKETSSEARIAEVCELPEWLLGTELKSYAWTIKHSSPLSHLSIPETYTPNVMIHII